jgi:DNA-binding transcriptional LysR family regulator
MLNINLKLLQTFLLVAKGGSFRRAAEDSHRSTAAVSMQIKQLEQQIGTALFHRTTRRVELTNDGERLLIYARNALAELEAGLLQIRESVDLHQGRLAIACVPTVAATMLPRILAAFQQDYPGIGIHVSELVAMELFEAVRRREVDFGIGPSIEHGGDFTFRPVFTDEAYALVPLSYRFPRRKTITLRELSQLPILRLSTSSQFRSVFDETMERYGLRSTTKFEVIQVQTLIAMAEAGLGAAILPGISVPPRTCLQVMRMLEPSLVRKICIITARGQALTPAASALASFVERLLAKSQARRGE